MEQAVEQPRKKDRALAYIIERIARGGVSPSLKEIAGELGVGETRARTLICQLVAEGRVERRPGAQRRLVVRDVAGSRHLLEDVLNRLGWAVNDRAAAVGGPCGQEHLPRISSLRYLPDVDTPRKPNEHHQQRTAPSPER